MKKILILGDSFAADWSVKYDDYKGWPNLLQEKYDVTNVAQAGVGEYKIYKQIMSIDLSKYDTIIISHTSPYRVHTRNHPIHVYDKLHKNADMIYNDIRYHRFRLRNILNRALKAAYDFFTYHFDDEYFNTTYWLYRKEIDIKLKKKHVIVIDNFHKKSSSLNFLYMAPQHSGKINHFSETGNRIIYDKLVQEIERYK